MEKLKRVFLLCFSIFVFSGVSYSETLSPEVIERVRESIVLLSSNESATPSAQSPNALCTGVVIDKVGHILTNFHCIYKQKIINLYYYDEEDWKEYEVKVIGKDPLADLALLEVSERTEEVPHLEIANEEDVHMGMEVFAFGHPMGMAWSLSKGIISSKDRHARHPYIKSLQTDAAINKGNSGGPLLNLKGEIVGINTLLVSRNQQYSGVGIAIRSDVVKYSLAQMLERGRVDRPAIGVQIITLIGKEEQQNRILKDNPELKKILPNTYGLIISKDTTDIPEGLKPWDTIVGINNVPVNTGVEFSGELIKNNIGDTIKLTLIRNRRYIQVEVPLKVLPIPIEMMYDKKKPANPLIPKPEKKE